MPFLRRKVISSEAVLVFDSNLQSILWANAAGTKLFGGNNVGELLEIDLNMASELMGQIKNALPQIQNNEPIVRGYRISKGITSVLIKGELSTQTLPDNSQVVLLVFAEKKTDKRKREHELAAMAVESLEGFADAAAIVDDYGLVIASSSKFDDMNVYPTVLHDLVKITAAENDRMVKRPIEQSARKTIAAGIGRIRDVPGRYLIVLADVDIVENEQPQPVPIEPSLLERTDLPLDTQPNILDDLPEELPKKTQGRAPHEEVYKEEVEADETWPSISTGMAASQTLKSEQQDGTPENKDGTLEAHTRYKKPLRFSFTIGPDKVIREISPELAKTVGPESADIAGHSWSQIAMTYGFDRSRVIDQLLEKTDTWSGKSVLWPVQNTDMLIPIDLAALPAFTKERKFDGFRGFGIIRDADAVVDPDGRGLHLSELKEGSNFYSSDPFSSNQSFDVGEFVPGILSDQDDLSDQLDQWGDDKQNQNSLSNPTDKSDELESTQSNEEQPIETLSHHGSNVTPLNVVPIRSHVTTPPQFSSIDDEQKHDADFSAQDLADNTSDVDNISDNDMLNQKERTAFEQIRMRLQGENQAQLPSNLQETNSIQSSSADLNSAVIVYRANETLFANDELLKIAGYESLDELAQAGGLEALLPNELEDDNAFSVLNLRRKDGELINVQPTLKRVDWNGAKALSLTFSKAEQHLAPPLINTISNEPSALDMVQVSDLESILDTATDGIIIVNSNGDIEALNASGEALFGQAFDDVKNNRFTTLFAKESQPNLDEYFSNLTNPGISGIMNDGREVIGLEANGGLIPLFISFGAIGQSKRYCAVLRDLTERKKSEENLVTAKRKAEAASDQKSEFLSRISHEIREPLNAIIGFSDIMIEERFGELNNARYREYLRDINRSGMHMLDLVNDLLDISKIEAGKLDLSYESVDLNLIARETVALLQTQANSQRIIIRTSLSRAVPNVVADVRSIRQIIMNLVSNAIKFSPQNSQVIVSTTYETNGEVGLRIRDTGHGMNEDELKLALEPYTQVSVEGSGRKSGTGLGLPLTKALVEANRAYFELESTPGEGTIAHIQFPSPRVLAD